MKNTGSNEQKNKNNAPGDCKKPSKFNNALIQIPEIDLSVTVVAGTSREDLKKAPGWYEESALPGKGNTAIAGHRTMYGAWFRHLDQLSPGNLIYLTWYNETFIYKVEKIYPVAKNDWSVIETRGYPALTLTTCHPVGSARQRLVVQSRLVSNENGHDENHLL